LPQRVEAKFDLVINHSGKLHQVKASLDKTRVTDQGIDGVHPLVDPFFPFTRVDVSTQD
jgi:hypothetical protein